jgi:hypothetical protein
MHQIPALGVIDYLGPAVAALAFIVSMSLVKEPVRRQLNAIVVAGVSGAYLSGGFGLWELWYPVAGTTLGYLGLRSHRYIGIAWLLHAGWDLAHHLYGNPIWPFMPTSSFGCLIFDTVLGMWFLAGAPSLNVMNRDTAAALMPIALPAKADRHHQRRDVAARRLGHRAS